MTAHQPNAIEQAELTPEQLSVLQQRFGLESDQDTKRKPSTNPPSDEDGGNSGGSTPAAPPVKP